MTADDLIARLEAASEGNRDLDDAIHLAVTGQSFRSSSVQYTRSLDAALTLVPEGKRWEAGQTAQRTSYAAVGYYRHTIAATPALALCIAALKARGEP